MSDSGTSVTLQTALEQAQRLLAQRPDLAQRQAEEILRVVPQAASASLILAQALRAQGRVDEAVTVLLQRLKADPRAAQVHFELALCLSQLGRTRDAVTALQAVVQLQPASPEAWRVLADHLDICGDETGASDARTRYLTVAVQDPQLRAAAQALQANQLDQAEPLLRSHLRQHPSDVAALRMLAELAARLRRYQDAEALLAHCLALAPGFDAARHQYGLVLMRQGKAAEARQQADNLLAKEPHNLGYLSLLAASLAHLGEYEASIAHYQRILARVPDQPRLWSSYGHALKTVGRTADCIDAYRQAIALQPANGEAYWSLANLKTFRFSPDDLANMLAALNTPGLADEERVNLHYALGKATEDAGQPDLAFTHYATGASLRLQLHPYDADKTTQLLIRSQDTYTAQLFAEREGQGCTDPAPIFIVGMPRAGSTLVEQILASHPLVEGTMELPDMPWLSRELEQMGAAEDSLRYPERVAQLDADTLRRLGELYLERTRVHRKKGTPFFIDKLPNNFLYVGLIHLILPKARVIDVRRHPMACCFSNFKQHFALGQGFSYSLTDMGLFYRDYVNWMAHIDQVLPGRVHRVIYEDLVEDPETQVRAMLAYCGLAFDEACLRFHENARAVRTASAEQVRRPINRDGLDQWRQFEPWLGPLRESLGTLVDTYPRI